MILRVQHMATVEERFTGRKGEQVVKVGKFIDPDGLLENFLRYNFKPDEPDLEAGEIVTIEAEAVRVGFNGSLNIRGRLVRAA